jgi:hypothetical protein
MLIFTNSMTIQQRMLLDASTGGSMKNKTPAEVEELIENMCLNEYNKNQEDEEILLDQLINSQQEQISKIQDERDSREQQAT